MIINPTRAWRTTPHLLLPFVGCWGSSPFLAFLIAVLSSGCRAASPASASRGSNDCGGAALIANITMVCQNPIKMYQVGINPDNGRRILVPKLRVPPIAEIPAIYVPCGKCDACLHNRRFEWINRLSLQMLLSGIGTFLTLTYNDKSLPVDGLANKSHVQKFIKRLRNVDRDYNISLPKDFKYFCACEYGSKSGRAHYHALLFGVDMLTPPWQPRLVGMSHYPYYSSQIVERLWSYGYNTVDRLSVNNITYVTKYLTKTSLSRKTWSLHSMRLGLGAFLDDGKLSHFGSSSFTNSFVAVPSACGSARSVPTPKALDRFAERDAPALFDLVKAKRLDYLKHMREYDISAQKAHISIIKADDKRKEKLT